MSTRKIREALQKLTPPNHHYRDELLVRNGRWGTCVVCPRDASGIYPERCVNTDRIDHHLKRDNHEAWAEVEAIERACKEACRNDVNHDLRKTDRGVDLGLLIELIAKDAP